jgi:hypothetical protein
MSKDPYTIATKLLESSDAIHGASSTGSPVESIMAIFISGASCDAALRYIATKAHASRPRPDYQAFLDSGPRTDPEARYQLAEAANEVYIQSLPSLSPQDLMSLHNGFHCVRTYYYMEAAFITAQRVHNQAITAAPSNASLPS